MSIFPSWSYSSAKLFETCPRKFQAERVTKEIPYEPGEAAVYGTALHKAAEDAVTLGVPVPAQFDFIKPYVEGVKRLPGDKLCELKLGVARRTGINKFEPCEFFDTDVWFRVVIDVAQVNGETGAVLDWKTSKNPKYESTKQLALGSAALALHYPTLRRINGALLFVIAKDVTRARYTVPAVFDIFSEYEPTLTRLQAAYDSDVWNTKQNGLCKQYCGVFDCPHNGRGR